MKTSLKYWLRMLLPLMFVAVSTTAFAQKEKVVESSAKHKPAWIGRSDQSSFAVTEVGETLAAASDRCMNSIRQHVINAVAVNISSTETMTSRQISQNALHTVMNDYSSVLMTEAAKLPYLNNLSLSNAEETYWEKIYDKKTKRYRYEYSVRYPFTEQTRRQLVEAFLAIDNAKVAQMEQLKAELDTFTDIDRITRAVNELDGLHQYFFDATRRQEAETLRRNYLAQYARISIEPEEETLGRCIYSLRLNGRRMTTAVTPRLKCESAIEMQVKAYDNNRYLLTYNAKYASKSDINTLEILYPFGGARVSRTLHFDPAQAPAQPEQ